MMTLDPAGLEAAAKLARSCTPTAREDARLAEQIVRAYLAAAPDTGRSVLMHVPVTPTTENPPENVYARLRNRPPEPSAAVAWDEGYVAGFAAGRAAATPDPPSDRNVARMFHEAYERLAPEFGYHTREESAVPWERVPARNRDLMTATVGEVRAHLAAASPDERLREAGRLVAWGLQYTTAGAKVLGDTPDSPVRLRGDLEATWLASVGKWLDDWHAAAALTAAGRDTACTDRESAGVGGAVTRGIVPSGTDDPAAADREKPEER